MNIKSYETWQILSQDCKLQIKKQNVNNVQIKAQLAMLREQAN